MKNALTIACVAVVAAVAGCQEKQFTTASPVSTEPMNIDPAMQAREWPPMVAKYANGDTTSGTVAFKYEPKSDQPFWTYAMSDIGTFFVNVVTLPVTVFEQRDGLVSTGEQLPPTNTAVPPLPTFGGREGSTGRKASDTATPDAAGNATGANPPGATPAAGGRGNSSNTPGNTGDGSRGGSGVGGNGVNNGSSGNGTGGNNGTGNGVGNGTGPGGGAGGNGGIGNGGGRGGSGSGAGGAGGGAGGGR